MFKEKSHITDNNETGDCNDTVFTFFQRKKRCKFWPVFIAGIFLIGTSVLDFTYMSNIKYHMPVVDLVELLQTKGIIEDVLILDLLKDIYIRREATYLENVSNSTIVIQPTLYVDPMGISLHIKEGYCFSSQAEEITYPPIGVQTIIHQTSERLIGETTSFMLKYVIPLHQSSKINESSELVKYFRLLKKGNIGISAVNGVLIVLALYYEIFVTGKMWSAFYVLVCIIAVSTGLIASTLYNMIISIIVTLNSCTLKSYGISSIYVFQYLFAMIIFIIYLVRAKRIFQYLVAEKLIKKQCETFQPSPPSSLYSPVKQGTLSPKLGIDPSSKAVVESPHNLTSLDPMYKKPPILENKSYLILAGPARMRPSLKMGINIEHSSSLVDGRSVSAPVFQWVGSSSTNSQVASPRLNSPRIDSTELIPCKSET